MTNNLHVAINVNTDQLFELLRSGITSNRWLWAYVERMEGSRLAWLETILENRPAWELVSHGRAFGEKSELAWWQTQAGLYRLRHIGEEGPTNVENIGWKEGNALIIEGDERTATRLYGTLDRESETLRWRENRIPLPHYYPLLATKPAPFRVTLEVQRLFDDTDGCQVFDRLIAVAPEHEGDESDE